MKTLLQIPEVQHCVQLTNKNKKNVREKINRSVVTAAPNLFRIATSGSLLIYE